MWFYIVGAVVVLALGYCMLLWRAAQPTIPAQSFPLDSTTPQGAIRLYHQGVRLRDIEAMVAAKDFEYEARQVLGRNGRDLARDAELIAVTARTLEDAFRAEWGNRTWPDLDGVQAYYSPALSIDATAVGVVEVLQYPDGRRERTMLRVVRRGSEWRLTHVE